MKKRSKEENTVLVATLGTEPQVVTLAVWALQHKLRPPVYPKEVWVVYTTDPSVRAAHDRLQKIFKEDYHLEGITLHTYSITSASGKKFADLESRQAINATFRTLFRVIRTAKEKGFQVHLSVAGGRKPMAIYGIVAAQLLFDDQDKAWHLISSKSLVESRRLFPVEAGDKVSLVPIPIIPWGDVDPILTVIAREEDPFGAAELVKTLRERRRHYALQLFVESRLSPAEQKVLRYVVVKGGTIREIAKALGKSPRTVEHQLQSVYSKIKDNQHFLSLNLPNNTKLTRDFLVRLFGDVFA